MNTNLEIVAFVGIAFACILRTMLPYWKKLKDETTLKFDLKYLASYVVVVVIGTAAAILILPAFPIPDTATSYMYVFATAFAYGWASDDIINKLLP